MNELVQLSSLCSKSRNSLCSCYKHISIQILFPVAYTGPKQSWKTSIRPSRTPYTASLRTEHDFWKELPRARCLACALKALTAANTPPPQSRQRPRPKSAPPRLSNQGQKARKSEFRPSTSSSTRKSLQPKASKSPRISPVCSKEGPSSAFKSSSSKKTPRVRSSYPKMSTPKSSTSVKKSLSFSPDTKEEETDSPPKPKGIRGGGRRRKAQLALMNNEELSTDDPRHAYYVLIHEDMKAGKPTASVKPIMSGEGEETVGSEESPAREAEGSVAEGNEANIDIAVTDVGTEATVVKKVTYVVSNDDVAVQNNIVNGVHDDHNGTVEVKIVPCLGENQATIALSDEKPQVVSNNSTTTPPSEEKQAERDWSKPKAIRGRRKKPNADMNGNEPGKSEEKQEVTPKKDVNGGQELQQQKLVLANGDS